MIECGVMDYLGELGQLERGIGWREWRNGRAVDGFICSAA